MKVVFRADASVQIGTGHVMRCLTLADELRRQGHACSFVCRDHEGHLGKVISRRGFGLTLLDTPASGGCQELEDTVPHAHLLGASWQQDAAQTKAALESSDVDWIVIDHYGLDARWEQELFSATQKIMVIDDLADRAHHANLLLDQNAMDLEMRQRYLARVNPDCKLALGPAFALLGQDYALCARSLPQRNGAVSRILVFVGGSDPYHLTETYLEALNREAFASIQVDVVIGPNHPSPDKVENLVSERPGTRCYSGLPTLSALMVRADLMLGAGGATNWERMCLGLNAIVTSVAPNQEKVNEELQNKGLITFLGKAETVTPEKVASALKEQIDSPATLGETSERMRSLVDGQGCKRVADTLMDQMNR